MGVKTGQHMKASKPKKNIDSIDIAKGFLCLAVMCIHVNPFPNKYRFGIFPISRVAVPLFFLFTGYLFFTRYNKKESTDQERSQLLRKQLKRLLVLYFSWLLILLVPTIRIRPWFDNGFWPGVHELVHSTFFGSSFVASWYIMTCVTAIVAVVFLKKIFPDYMIVLIGAILYLNCLLMSNYYGISNKYEFCKSIIDFWHTVHIQPCFSLPGGLIWIAIANFISLRLDRIVGFFKRTNLIPILLTFSLACLYFEEYCIERLKIRQANDCYVFLIPVCALLFLSIIMTDIRVPFAPVIRNCSTLFYVTHATLKYRLDEYFAAQGFAFSNLQMFCIVFALCSCISFIIISLSKRETFKWLRWLY